MKIPTIPLLLTALLTVVAVPALAQAQTADQARSSAAYVSDLLDVPLRAGASNRYKIIGAVRSGTAVEVLRMDTVRATRFARPPEARAGCLAPRSPTRQAAGNNWPASARIWSSCGVGTRISSNIWTRWSASREENPQLSAVVRRGAATAPAIGAIPQVSADTVAIDERNKTLQEQAVVLERELQLVQQENRALRDDNDNLRF